MLERCFNGCALLCPATSSVLPTLLHHRLSFSSQESMAAAMHAGYLGVTLPQARAALLEAVCAMEMAAAELPGVLTCPLPPGMDMERLGEGAYGVAYKCTLSGAPMVLKEYQVWWLGVVGVDDDCMQ